MEVQGLKQFSIEELAKVDDGRIAEAFNQALRRVAMDVDDRPGDDRPRKLNLEIAIVPVCDESGLCDSVKLQMQIKESLPTRKSRVYDMGLRKGGLMVYQPMSPENHHQQPLIDEDDDA